MNPLSPSLREEMIEDRCGDYVQNMEKLRAKLQAAAAETHRILQEIVEEGGSLPIEITTEDIVLTDIDGTKKTYPGRVQHFDSEESLAFLESMAFNGCDGCMKMDAETFYERASE